MRTSLPPRFWSLLWLLVGLVFFQYALTVVNGILADMADDLAKQATLVAGAATAAGDADPASGIGLAGSGLELTGWSIALNDAALRLIQVSSYFNVAATILAIGLLLWVAVHGRLVKRRDPDDGNLSAALQVLIDGLADAESRAASSRVEVAKMEAEKERLRELATLTPGQLKAIKTSVSPGARLALIVGLVGLVLSLVLWGIDHDALHWPW